MIRHRTALHRSCGLVARAEGTKRPQSGHSARPTAPRLLCTLSRDCVGARQKRAYCGTHRSARSATITCLTFNSYPVPNCGTQKFLRKTGQVTAVTVGAPVAALAAKTERRRVVFKVGPSTPMHLPSTLTRGATGEAVLTLEMHSREPYGHASRPRPSARRRLWRPRLRDDRRL